MKDATQVVGEQLLPLVEELCAITRAQGSLDQEAFFQHIHKGLVAAQEPDDLAGPFMELSTSAFRGFLFSTEVTLLLDHALAIAQTVSMTLSASSDAQH